MPKITHSYEVLEKPRYIREGYYGHCRKCRKAFINSCDFMFTCCLPYFDGIKKGICICEGTRNDN